MNNWITTADALPNDGDAVQFLVDERDITLHGRYESCAFKSRWWCHSPVDIRFWRKLDDAQARHEAERAIFGGRPRRMAEAFDTTAAAPA
jgi:hypothetical protein